MINGRTTGRRLLWGEQRLQPLPWRMGYISSVHTHQDNDVNRVCKHDLGSTARLLTGQARIYHPSLLLPHRQGDDMREIEGRKTLAH
jgi:hypothetical protein